MSRNLKNKISRQLCLLDVKTFLKIWSRFGESERLRWSPAGEGVVEVKRMNHIGSEIEEAMREKIRRLPLREGMSARPVLVYDGELAPAVSGRGYLDSIIPARKLIGL